MKAIAHIFVCSDELAGLISERDSRTKKTHIGSEVYKCRIRVTFKQKTDQC
jgi:hypothetical protein